MNKDQETRVYYHATPKDNIKNILQYGLMPRVGPRSEKANEAKPLVYMFGCYDDLEDALLNWLGDELDGTDPEILQIHMPADFAAVHVMHEPNFTEHMCDVTIPPDWIVRLGHTR